MSSPLLITSLSSSSKAEKLQPIEEFRLFEMRGQFHAREFWWGLEPGEIDIDSSLNKVAVRGDIARLLSKDALTLVPSKEVIESMLELTKYNQRSQSVSDRRRCFEVLPVQSYTYRLVPGEQKKQLPLFAFDSGSGTFQRFEYPYSDLPSFTLDCYPFHVVMHSCFALPRVCESKPRAIDECHSDIFFLSHQWRIPYPQVGKFALPPDIAAQKAAALAALDAWYGNVDSSDSDLSEEKVVLYSPQRTSKKVKSWLETVQLGKPTPPLESPVILNSKDGGLDVLESKIE